MSRIKNLRRQRFIDPKVQGALVVRVIVYWFVCLITITLMLMCWKSTTDTARPFYSTLYLTDMWNSHGAALIASLLVLPIVVLDVVRLSNRFAGPMVRIRHAMRAIDRGECPQPIHFREGDFWHDFAEEFNAVLRRIEQEQQPPAEPEPELAGSSSS